MAYSFLGIIMKSKILTKPLLNKVVIILTILEGVIVWLRNRLS